MSAPDMVDVVAAAMYCSDADEVGQCGDEAYYQRQARAVLAALEGAGTVEWGVRTGPLPVMVRKSKQSALNQIGAFGYGTLVSRPTLPWTAVE